MTNLTADKTTLRVSFKNSIDNDDYKFSNEAEAIAVAKKLTNDKCGSFDWNESKDSPTDSEVYQYLVFSEYVYVAVELDGSPLYSQISDVRPTLFGGEFCSVKKIVALDRDQELINNL